MRRPGGVRRRDGTLRRTGRLGRVGNQVTKQSSNQATKQSSNQAIKQSINHGSTWESWQSSNQATKQPNNQAIKQSSNQAITGRVGRVGSGVGGAVKSWRYYGLRRGGSEHVARLRAVQQRWSQGGGRRAANDGGELLRYEGGQRSAPRAPDRGAYLGERAATVTGTHLGEEAVGAHQLGMKELCEPGRAGREGGEAVETRLG